MRCTGISSSEPSSCTCHLDISDTHVVAKLIHISVLYNYITPSHLRSIICADLPHDRYVCGSAAEQNIFQNVSRFEYMSVAPLYEPTLTRLQHTRLRRGTRCIFAALPRTHIIRLQPAISIDTYNSPSDNSTRTDSIDSIYRQGGDVESAYVWAQLTVKDSYRPREDDLIAIIEYLDASGRTPEADKLRVGVVCVV